MTPAVVLLFIPLVLASNHQNDSQYDLYVSSSINDNNDSTNSTLCFNKPLIDTCEATLLVIVGRYLKNFEDCVNFRAYVLDCIGEYDWKNDLEVCADDICERIQSTPMDPYGNSWQYLVPQICYSKIPLGSTNVSLSISTLGPTIWKPFTYNKTVTVVVEPTYSGNCQTQTDSRSFYGYCPSCYFVEIEFLSDYHCKEGRTGTLCGSCTAGYGISMNNINTCVECNVHWSIFLAIELLPITVMVCLIVVFNIQLTNGSINGLVFYSQIILASFHVFLTITIDDYCNQYPHYLLYLIGINILNIDFTLFFPDYSCVLFSPLGAISFWYVIVFYPLILLFLLYVWLVLYDKGFECVVFVTRPFHRCLARFWSMTKIEPSFTHSTASIYMLCFTQLIFISVKLLKYTPVIQVINGTVEAKYPAFYYDASFSYFTGFHGLAASFAILVLLFLILLPYLYIQLYPFKLFQKLLTCLCLNKPLLISLGDVFTGPYKNGSDNTFDYRFVAGAYLLARIVILLPFIVVIKQSFIFYTIQAIICFLLAAITIFFRPLKKAIHNFNEFILLASLFCISVTLAFRSQHSYNWIPVLYGVASLNGLILCIILLYITICFIHIIWNCYHYCKRPLQRHFPNIPEEDQQHAIIDDTWLPDRIRNPQDYIEQHLPPIANYQVNNNNSLLSQAFSTGRATYGSMNNPVLTEEEASN